MAATVRLLGPADEPILAALAEQEEAFDLAGRGEPSILEAEAAAAYLADPGVLHWVAEEAGEIGVREECRRQGVGSALVAAMRGWMKQHGAVEAWVLADNPGAQRFYAACGFERDDEQGVQMLLTAT